MKAVVVRYDEALVDPYTWITALVDDGRGRWLGSKQLRGPIGGDGRIRVGLGGRSPEPGERLVVEFGLQVASACPNVDGGTVLFPSVVVQDG